MRRLLPLVLAGLLAGGCSLRSAAPPASPHCRSGSPLAGVYHPARLKVKSRCRVAVGTVEKVKQEFYDGDVHIELKLDRGQEGLLSSGNARVGAIAKQKRRRQDCEKHRRGENPDRRRQRAGDSRHQISDERRRDHDRTGRNHSDRHRIEKFAVRDQS